MRSGNVEAPVAQAHEEEIESRFEATVAVGLVIALQLTLALVSLGGGWRLAGLPGWVWLIAVVPEAALLGALSLSAPRHRLEQTGHRRTVALALVGVITAANALALVALIASVLSGQERSGGQLLFKGLTIWGTNVVAFGLLFWEVDRGGPIRRGAAGPPARDFQFPQDENPKLAEPSWHPRLADYVYVSFVEPPREKEAALLRLREASDEELALFEDSIREGALDAGATEREMRDAQSDHPSHSG